MTRLRYILVTRGVHMTILTATSKSELESKVQLTLSASMSHINWYLDVD